MFKTLKEAQAWIESVEKFGQKYDLSRMKKACALLNHPERTFQSVHIGGTNGKGSTLAYIKESLQAAGYSVGTFTSPYIVHFNERITLNNTMISDKDLLYYLNEIYRFQATYRKRYGDQITFFELLTLLSFLYFKDHPVDVVLYEVGLGGTLDATNVITPILSIITSIGYDHMGVLGNTLASIAENKLGIVKAKVPLISGITQTDLKPLIKARIIAMQSPWVDASTHPFEILEHTPLLRFVYQDTIYQTRMLGSFQAQNAVVALCALEQLHTQGFKTRLEDRQKGLLKAFMPGRFERFENPLTILDGAHNIHGLKASVETLNEAYPKHKKTFIFAVMADKDYRPMLKLLDSQDARIIFTEIPYVRSEKADVLYQISKAKTKYVCKDYQAAWQKARELSCLEAGVIYLGGSLYFISMIRRIIAKT